MPLAQLSFLPAAASGASSLASKRQRTGMDISVLGSCGLTWHALSPGRHPRPSGPLHSMQSYLPQSLPPGTLFRPSASSTAGRMDSTGTEEGVGKACDMRPGAPGAALIAPTGKTLRPGQTFPHLGDRQLPVSEHFPGTLRALLPHGSGFAVGCAILVTPIIPVHPGGCRA